MLQDHWNDPPEEDAPSRDLSEELIFKRGLLMDWARYELRFSECAASAIAGTEASQYLKWSMRASQWRALAERQEAICKALMLPAEIMIGLLWAMMELERNEAAQVKAPVNE